MSLPLFQVDAFTSRAFAGNPAAVCFLEEPRPDDWMQQVAAEMNLSETAFLLPETDGWRLRWFTPVLEVDLCGHATLASAHVLWETARLNLEEPARFHTRSGLLTAERVDGLIELDFPTRPPERCDAPDGMAEALGVRVTYVGKNRAITWWKCPTNPWCAASLRILKNWRRWRLSASLSPAVLHRRVTISSRVSSPPRAASMRTP